jgi:xanthine dehydrogenase small subunit
MDRLRFCLNDRWLELSGISPTTTLLRYLRDALHLTGSKEGCAEGDCGACSVAVVEMDPSGAPQYRAVNACLMLLPMVQGKRVYTVEALKESGRYHLVQEALAQRMGSQCGYCTPGIVMSLFEACYRRDLDAPWKIDAQMCGNLCRCTGYRPIRDAAVQVAGAQPEDRFAQRLSQSAPEPMQLTYSHGAQRFFTPGTLTDLFDVLDQHPSARFVVGGTDLSLEVTKRFAEPPLLVSLEGIAELRPLEAREGHARIGAAVPLTDVESFTEARLSPVARMLRYFGARQIKHRATVGGNLCTASPIGDLAPVLIALGAQAGLVSRAGTRTVPLESFFLAYRKTALEPREVLAWVDVPWISPTTRACAYKVSKRRELDISAVSAAFAVDLASDGTVRDARIAYGGMAATPARAGQVEAMLIGQSWSRETVAKAAALISRSFTPVSDHRGSAQYRSLVARNLLVGFFEETQRAPVPELLHPHTATVQP